MADQHPPLAVGDVLTGPVTSVKRFGAFVALGEVEGLVDAWWLQENGRAWPVLGTTVTVCVEKIDENGKVSLSLVS